MARTATTIEQGKKLLELGISPETADMCYVDGILEEDDWLFFHKHYDGEICPAWSADALEELLVRLKRRKNTESETLQ